MLDRLQEAFAGTYGSFAKLVVRAPGRVNLIGEHTDYNQGLVFPCAIDYECLVAVSPRWDREVNVVALDWQGQADSFSLDELVIPHPRQQWSNYVRGVASEMLVRDLPLSGCDLAITGNVPQGAGLSSSAALEVGVGMALAQAAGLSLDRVELARIGRDAENNFVGCACGIMDQLISAKGRAGHALMIDCRDLSLDPVPVPPELAIVIINSNVQRGLVDSEYNTRRRQCEEAARHFGVASLRDLSLANFEAGRNGLDSVTAMRVQHVLEENDRVLGLREALIEGDLRRIGEFMAGSHRSMRDLFEITTPAIDTLVEIARDVIGDRGGVRMTGGGFGGCVVALVETGLVDELNAAVADKYQRLTNLKESTYLTRPASGVSVLPG